MTYRLYFVCLRCGEPTLKTQRHSWPLPAFKCGHCLMDGVESFELKCLGVQRINERP